MADSDTVRQKIVDRIVEWFGEAEWVHSCNYGRITEFDAPPNTVHICDFWETYDADEYQGQYVNAIRVAITATFEYRADRYGEILQREANRQLGRVLSRLAGFENGENQGGLQFQCTVTAAGFNEDADVGEVRMGELIVEMDVNYMIPRADPYIGHTLES